MIIIIIITTIQYFINALAQQQECQLQSAQKQQQKSV
jgi:hypothetical protein